MTKRIEARFEKCRAEGRAALVTYVMAGDPDPETSLEILKSLPKAGADIVEFGLPFTDPMADGPAIQAAGLRALKVGQDTVKTLDQIDPGEFELIVTLSPEAHHAALELTRDTATMVEYWPMPDPSVVEADRQRRLESYREVREMLAKRMMQRFGRSAGVDV